MVVYGGAVVCGGVWCEVVYADVNPIDALRTLFLSCTLFRIQSHSTRRRLHGVQELVLFVLAVVPPSIPFMHQQLSMTTTFSGPETLGDVNAS